MRFYLSRGLALDPFSPILFSFWVSFVLYPVEAIPRTNPYMYVDDLCVSIRGMRIGHLLHQVYDCMSHFVLFLRLHLNLANLAKKKHHLKLRTW